MATPEAVFSQEGSAVDYTTVAAVEGGTVVQMPDGRAGVVPKYAAAATLVGAQVCGLHTVAKTTSQVWIDGCRLWWDHSANAATCVPPLTTGDKDFYLGVCVGDVAAATATGKVNLNVRPTYVFDVHRDLFDHTLVKTVVGSTTIVIPDLIARGGTIDSYFGLTAEAQKLDILSKRSFPLASNPILEAVINIVTTCDADVGDLSIGFANASHASDADSITESVFFHYDLGADLNIDAESDDGTTEVAATDTTIDFAEGTPHYLCIDGRDPSDMKFYINGVEVLNATANLGNVALAAGPLKALFHMEKSANDSPGRVLISELQVRLGTNE
jgi:predicted RecA/RadA family phage recombinase